ncbi:FG-GAP repeat domain-containing protein [Roseovarius indicus]|uniref:FG-GAP repeat domain-containing protein n=1 Tax=Roseovarius indicus TaxID=540747 RepID=UPI000AE6D0F2|nr:VCBS repeat-containing protein [Roseovarius indicus]
MRLAAAVAFGLLLPVVGWGCEARTGGHGLPGRFAEADVINEKPGGGVHEGWVARGARLVMHAGFLRETDEYGHGVLGDLRDAKALTIHLRLPGDERITCPAEVILPEGEVFEDIAPRLADLDGDGLPEIVVVQSNAGTGAKLAIYDRRGRLVAATPNIGQRHRWLAPAAVADLDGDGHMELAYVDRPHLAKRLRVWRFRKGKLEHVADAEGFTNHRIGWDFIAGGLRRCGSTTEITTANSDWTRIVAARLTSGRIARRDLGPYTGPDSLDAATNCP